MKTDHSKKSKNAQPRRRTVARLFGVDRGTRSIAGMRLIQESLPGCAPDNIAAKRGAVTDYSYASRRRLREAVLSVAPALLPRRSTTDRRYLLRPATFVTLTYPNKFEPDARACKQHLNTWLQRVKHRWPDAWAVWCIERQQRGAWHFHLIIRWPVPARGAGGWRKRQEWTSTSWAEVVAGDGAVDPDHLAAGTRLDKLISGKALIEYVAKPGSKSPAAVAGEMSKARQKVKGQGRWWGIHNRRAYDAAVVVLDVHLPQVLAARIWRALLGEWETKFKRWGISEPDWLPRWCSGIDLDRVLAGACAGDALRALPGIDVRTGELLPPIDDVVADEFGKAAAA